MNYPKFLSWFNWWQKNQDKAVIPEHNNIIIIESSVNASKSGTIQVQKTKSARPIDFAGPINGWLNIVKKKWIPPHWLPHAQYEELKRRSEHGDQEAIDILIAMRPFGHYEDIVIQDWKHNLLTNGGRDFFHNQSYTNTVAGTRGSGFVVLSESAVAPAATDTVVAGEITTGGLARADATTKTHTIGTNSTTIEHIFTATAAFTAVQKSGLLNASSAGTLSHENTFTATALAINDQLKVTWTLTLG